MPCIGQDEAFRNGQASEVKRMEIQHRRDIDLMRHSMEIRNKIAIDNLYEESILCSACKALEDLKYDFDKNPRLAEWWYEHKLKDQERLLQAEKERLQKEAIFEIAKKPFNKLTNDDKKLLKKHGYL